MRLKRFEETLEHSKRTPAAGEGSSTMSMDTHRRSIVSVILLILILSPWKAESSAAQTETLIGIVGRDFVLLGADSALAGGSIAWTATHVDKIAVLTNPFPESDAQQQPQPQQVTQTVAVQEDRDDSNNQEAPPVPLLRPHRLSNQQQQQQTIAAAVAGDTADADRLVGYLKATGTLQEYQASVGCDVDYYNHHFDPPQTRMHWKPRNQPQHQPRLYPVAPPPRPGGGGGGAVTVEATAHCARQYIYERLRSSLPCNVCLLVAGMMPDDNTNDQTQQDKENNSDESSLSWRVRQQVTRALQQQQQGSPVLSQAQEHRQDTLANHSTTPNVPDVDGDNQQSHEDSSSAASPSTPTTTTKGLLRPHLYWLDEYGSLQRMKEYGVHGLASAFVWSILDQNYHPNMSLEQATTLMHHCFDQLRQRYLINHHAGTPCIKCLDATHGCRLLLS